MIKIKTTRREIYECLKRHPDIFWGCKFLKGFYCLECHGAGLDYCKKDTIEIDMDDLINKYYSYCKGRQMTWTRQEIKNNFMFLLIKYKGKEWK
jgi:hypothetical protein